MMKRRLLLLLLSAFFVVACDKIPVNGDLDGMWQLIQYRGDLKEVQSYIPKGIYWNFQLKMMNIHTPLYLHNKKTVYSSGLFSKTKDSLRINKLYIHFYNQDSLITDEKTHLFENVGIKGNHETFYIQRLTHEKMVLATANDTLIFRKLG